jgi:hypothetical protein
MYVYEFLDLAGMHGDFFLTADEARGHINLL